MNPHSPCSWVFSAAAAWCCFLLMPAMSQGQETLDQALDNPALAWTAGGDADWKVVSQPDAHAGSSVAELWLETTPGHNYGFILGEPVSWLETAATGPGLFTVWVRHNYNPYTMVDLSVDGVVGEEHLIYGYPPGEKPFTGWYRLTAYVPPGSHPVRLTHRFAVQGTLYFDNPKVQADDARVLSPLGTEFLDALDVPAGGGQWVAGGGGEFHVLPAADAHDGVDALGSDAAPTGWDDWGVMAPWLQGDITGPVTLYGWQRSAGPNGNPPAGEWEHFLFFIPPGSSRLKWSGWGMALDEFRELSAPEADLKDALESGGLVFTQTGGVWKGVRTWAAPDGTDAAWTTLPAEGQSSLSTTVDGPALMQFFWTAQSMAGFIQDAPDTALSCTVDGITLKLNDGSWSGVLPAGPHTIKWTVTSEKAAGKAAALLLDQVQVTPLASVPLTQALDTTSELVWTTGGKPWTGVASSSSPDGLDAVVPPVPAAGEVPWLETRVTGPGRLTFQWAGVETMPSWYDPPRGLALDLDGRRIIHQNTAQSWPVLELSAGMHTLRWTVTGTDNLLRPLMLDQVQWTPQETPVWLEAVEQPALAFFSADGNLLSLETGKSFAGGSSLRLATTGGWNVSPRSPTLLAIANQPGYLSFYYQTSPKARLSSPGGSPANGEWHYSSVFLEPGALTLNWTVTGPPDELDDPQPFALLDNIKFQPTAQIDPAQALNQPGSWRTSPAAPWIGLQELGVWSGNGTIDFPSWLEYDITGPALVAFNWSGLGLGFGLDGLPPVSVVNYVGPRRYYRWIPAGSHTVRWESTSDRASISDLYIGAVSGEVTITPWGTDFLIRVPRPAGLPDSLISLQANTGGLNTYWRTNHPTVTVSSTEEAITYLVTPPAVPRCFFRAAFGYR